MKRFFASIVLLILVASQGIAQSRSGLKGTVTDSLTKEALEFSTVAILDLKDSSLVSYTLTLKGGGFILHNLPAEKELKLVVSFVGYQNFRKVLTLEKGSTLDAGAIKLTRKGNLLSEVKVTAELTPVIIKKDTIEFSAEAFKTPPNAVVEQLLKRLPGVQVNLDGSITVNGKKVNKLLIDGKQFFVNDPKIASRNLDANLIDKVQVYDDRENDPDHLVPDSRVDKIINLKFKKAIKKSTFGKIRGGGGTRDRFDGGLLYNMFRDTLQISLIGIGNNLNRTGFSSGDLNDLGGFNRSGSDALDNGSVATGGKGYGGIQTVGSGGINLNNNYGNSLKLNLLYYYSYTSDVYRSAAFSQQFFSDTTLNTNSTSTTHNTDNRHTISGLIEWEPDTLFKVRYVPRISYTGNGANFTNNNNSFNNYMPRLNESINSGNSDRNAIQFQQSLSYYRKLHKKGSSLNITHDLNISPGTGLAYSVNNFTSYSSLLPSSNIVRLADNATGNTDASLDITYRYRFNKKLIGNVSLNANYNHNLGRLITYNQDLQTGRYDIYIDSLSRNLQRYQFTQTLRPELNYQINKETVLSINLGMQMMQTDNHFNRSFPDIDRQGVYLLPAIRFYNAKLSLNYSSSVRQPSINDLLPQTTFYSQLYSSLGNPDLKPTRSHNFNLNYYTYKSEKLLNTSIYSGLNLDENSVFTQRTVSSEGATIARPVNRNGKYYIYLGANLGKGFKKFHNWQIRLNYTVYSGLDHNFFQVNSKEGYQNSSLVNFNQQVFITYNNKLDINPSYNLSSNITSYQHLEYSTVKYLTHSLSVPIVIRWPKQIVVETNYTYTYNPLIASGFQRSINLLNLSVARLIQKQDRGEIKLSCYDLLNQNNSAYRYITANTTVDAQSQILKRYLLLTYAYRFNKTITKK